MLGYMDTPRASDFFLPLIIARDSFITEPTFRLATSGSSLGPPDGIKSGA